MGKTMSKAMRKTLGKTMSKAKRKKIGKQVREIMRMSNRNYTRGEIYFVKYRPITGAEMPAGHPAVIVSNNKRNKYSPVVEMVYLTTAKHKDLPTHVRINSTKHLSTALCEQIVSIDKSRLEKYCGCCTQQEMQQIDQALLVSLGLVSADKQGEPVSEQTGRAPTATGRLGRCERRGTVACKEYRLCA